MNGIIACLPFNNAHVFTLTIWSHHVQHQEALVHFAARMQCKMCPSNGDFGRPDSHKSKYLFNIMCSSVLTSRAYVRCCNIEHLPFVRHQYVFISNANVGNLAKDLSKGSIVIYSRRNIFLWISFCWISNENGASKWKDKRYTQGLLLRMNFFCLFQMENRMYIHLLLHSIFQRMVIELRRTVHQYFYF